MQNMSVLFCFKQKTAYEMRIKDWSSDVCSSDLIDPSAPEEMAEVEAINAGLVERALAMDGTCTGEDGIGIGKQEWLVAELGDAVEQMRMIKRALDPQNLLNPGKIFAL